MGRGQRGQSEQVAADVRFVVPCVDHGVRQPARATGLDQVLVDDDPAPRGVDEHGAGLHRCEKARVGHGFRRVVAVDAQRHVACDDVALGQHFVQFRVVARRVLLRFGRVAAQHPESEALAVLGDERSDASDSYDAERPAGGSPAVAPGQRCERGHHVLQYAPGVASRCRPDFDPVFAAVRRVDVVVPDRGRGDQPDRGPVEQASVAAGAGADNQRVGAQGVGVRDFASLEVLHVGIGFQYAFQERNVAVGNDVGFVGHLLSALHLSCPQR